MGVWLLVVLVGAAVPAAEPANDLVNAELKKLEGQWLVVSSERSGKKYPTGNEHWVFVGDRARVHLRPGNADKNAPFVVNEGNLLLTYHFKLDPSKSPKEIDMTFLDGPNKERVGKGIYEISGDKLKICRSLDPQDERPKDFKTEGKNNYFVMVWERQP